MSVARLALGYDLSRQLTGNFPRTDRRAGYSMIPKSVQRFLEKIMLKPEARGMTIQ
jgi:hypothetical protein